MSDSKNTEKKENTSSRHIKDNKDKSLKLEKKNQEKFSQGSRNPLGTNLRKKVFR
ncbi:MAG: hypothetical protein WCF78_01265 [archaeon]